MANSARLQKSVLATALLATLASCSALVGETSQVSMRIIAPEEIGLRSELGRSESKAIIDSTTNTRFTGLSPDACYFLNTTGQGVDLIADPETETCDHRILGLGRITPLLDKGDEAALLLPLGGKTIDLVAFKKAELGVSGLCKDARFELRVNNRNLDSEDSVDLLLNGVEVDANPILIARGNLNVVAGPNNADLIARWGNAGANFGCKSHEGGGGGPGPGSIQVDIHVAYPYWSPVENNTQAGIRYFADPGFVFAKCAAIGNQMNLTYTPKSGLPMPTPASLGATCAMEPVYGIIAKLHGVATKNVDAILLTELQAGITLKTQTYRIYNNTWSPYEVVAQPTGDCGSNGMTYPCDYNGEFAVGGTGSSIARFLETGAQTLTVASSHLSSGPVRVPYLTEFAIGSRSVTDSGGFTYNKPTIQAGAHVALDSVSPYVPLPIVVPNPAAPSQRLALSFPSTSSLIQPQYLGGLSLPNWAEITGVLSAPWASLTTGATAYSTVLSGTRMVNGVPGSIPVPLTANDGLFNPIASDGSVVAMLAYTSGPGASGLLVNRSKDLNSTPDPDIDGSVHSWLNHNFGGSFTGPKDLQVSAPAGKPVFFAISAGSTMRVIRCGGTANREVVCDADGPAPGEYLQKDVSAPSNSRLLFVTEASGQRRLVIVGSNLPTNFIEIRTLGDTGNDGAGGPPVSVPTSAVVHWPTMPAGSPGSPKITFLREIKSAQHQDLLLGIGDYYGHHWLLRSPDLGVNWYVVGMRQATGAPSGPDPYVYADAILFNRTNAEGTSTYGTAALLLHDPYGGSYGKYRFLLQGGHGY